MHIQSYRGPPDKFSTAVWGVAPQDLAGKSLRRQFLWYTMCSCSASYCARCFLLKHREQDLRDEPRLVNSACGSKVLHDLEVFTFGAHGAQKVKTRTKKYRSAEGYKYPELRCGTRLVNSACPSTGSGEPAAW